VQPPQRLDGGPHVRPGREPVVDDDHHHAGDVERRGVLAVGLFPALQLASFRTGDALDDVRREVQAAHHVVVEDHHAAAGDRPHGQLLLAGDPEFAHDEHVQRRAQPLRHLVAHWHASAGQGQHHDVGALSVVAEQLGQGPAGIPAVAEDSLRHTRGLPPPRAAGHHATA
jgi:hypothetical protein